MSIGGVEEIDLSPFERRFWLRGGIEGLWLHPADISGENNITLWMLAALACVYRNAYAAKGECKMRQVHDEPSQFSSFR